MKSLLLAILIGCVALTCKAQSDGYVHYTPIPITPTTPQPPLQLHDYLNPPPPPQAYYNTTSRTAPKPVIGAAFLIYSAKINGQDYSLHYKNNDAMIALYTFEDDPNTQYFAVVIPGDNSSSGGRIGGITTSEVPQTTTDYGMTKMVFAWDFKNNPDGSKGTAIVTLVKQYRPQGTAFSCHIHASNGHDIDFTGVKSQ